MNAQNNQIPVSVELAQAMDLEAQDEKAPAPGQTAPSTCNDFLFVEQPEMEGEIIEPEIEAMESPSFSSSHRGGRRDRPCNPGWRCRTGSPGMSACGLCSHPYVYARFAVLRAVIR